MMISISIIELDKVVHGFLWCFLVEIEPFVCSIRNFQISFFFKIENTYKNYASDMYCYVFYIS